MSIEGLKGHMKHYHGRRGEIYDPFNRSHSDEHYYYAEHLMDHNAQSQYFIYYNQDWKDNLTAQDKEHLGIDW